MTQAPDSHRIERLGRFTIHRVIGEGGMGIVYHAIDPASNQRVALKVLRSDVARNASARARFEGEMRILSELQHPCVVRSLGAEEVNGKLMLVLEYLEGRTLRDTLTAQGALRADHAVAVARQVASALVAAHGRERPIVHRDLKPENLMLLPGGAVKIMDFGIAKILQEADGVSHTTQAVGTMRYMSPEQADGSGITPKADLYALGIVLYEMLAGAPPFDAPSLLQVVRLHAEAPPPVFTAALRAQIPAELEALVFALLAKRPADRPDAARALAMLDQIAEAPRAAGPTVLAASASPRDPLDHATASRAPQALAAPAHAVQLNPKRSAPAELDTIALIDGKTRRRVWPIVAMAGGLLAVGGAVIAVLLVRSSETSSTRTTSARARVDTPPTTAPPGTARPAPPQLICTPPKCALFAPPDPAHLPYDLALKSAADLARSLDPTVKLAAFVLDAPFRAGVIDLTAEHARLTIEFEGADKRMSVRVTTTTLEAQTGNPARSVPLPEPFCALAEAEQAARARGMTFDVAPRATLSVSPIDESAIWNLHEGDHPHKTRHAILTGKTCTVRSISTD